MKNQFFTLLVLSRILFVLTSCSLIETEEVVIPKTVPTADGEVLPRQAPLEIHFPHEPDPDSIADLFEVRTHQGPMKGRMDLEGGKLTFIPREDPVPGTPHFLSLSGSYRSLEGKSYYVNLLLTFYWGGKEYLDPKIVSLVPEKGGVISPNGSVRIVFINTSQMEEIESALRIIPKHSVAKIWEFREDGTTELTVTPDPDIPWEVDTYYIITGLPPDGLGETGFWVRESQYPIIQSLSRVDPDWDNSFPVIASGLDGINLKEAVEIRFSLAMDETTVREGFSISPSIGGRFLWPEGNRMIFLPADTFHIDTRYILHINRKAKSKLGSPMREDYTVTFDPANPFLDLIQVDGRPEDGFPLTDPDSVEISIPIRPSLTSRDYTFRFAFTDTFDNPSVKEKAQDWIDLKRTYPGTGPAPIKTGAVWIHDALLSLTWYDFPEPSPGSSVYFLLVLPGGEGGIQNSQGKILKETISIPLKVESP